ncbi:MAG: hypothetical protein F9K38_14685 [Pseudorhodoplanes sp.]|nr:MAG: hypothetical protein F9K38_14685 [Pseudorhodoplanes sp.]
MTTYAAALLAHILIVVFLLGVEPGRLYLVRLAAAEATPVPTRLAAARAARWLGAIGNTALVLILPAGVSLGAALGVFRIMGPVWLAATWVVTAAWLALSVAADRAAGRPGGGAWLNGSPLRATAGSALQGARIAGPQRYLDRLAQVAPEIVRVPKIHSLALRLARVAQGQIDAGLASVHAHDWDLAAADLLVHEAGGVMTDASGKALVYNLHNPMHGALIAAGRDRHQAVLALVRDSWTHLA